MANTLKKRSEVDVKDTWAIEDIYKDITAYEADVKKAQDVVEEIVAMKGRICENGKTLYAYYKALERFIETAYKTYGYAARLSDADTKNSENQAILMKMGTTYAVMVEKMSFAEPEVLEGLVNELDRFYAEEPGLHEFDVQIKESLRTKDHVLSPEMEQLIAQTQEVLGGAGETFGMFNNADLTFPTIIDDKGEEVQISHGRYRMLLENPDVRVRRELFEKYYAPFEGFKNTLASNYQTHVKGQIFMAKARKYASAIERGTDINNVPVSVYNNLVETVNKNLDKLHRYMAVRKKLLGFEEMHMYDLFIPLVEGVDKKYTFEEAKEIVLEALKPMGEDYVKLIRRAFEERWIDIYENEGKRSGAYSAGIYGVHPFILLNFDGGLDSVFTLIHELGHAMHSYLSSEKQSVMNSEYVIFVAEVASTCNEALLTKYLLSKTTDRKERAYIINHMLDDFRTTLFRQTMFAEFEKETHAMVEAGESLTAEVLSKVYYDMNVKYYGDAVVSDPQIACEWARIPHFFYNFYVYQYSTGYSAALALSNRILTEGEKAVKDYLEFLSGGCTKSPTDLLKGAGVDMTSPKPVEDAMVIFADMIDELEKCM